MTLTPDGWLVYVNRGKEVLYSRRLRATPEWIAELRGAPEAKRPSDPAPSEKPARGEGTPGSKAAKARGCTCPEQSGAMWTVDPECRLHGYGAVG